MSEMKLAGSVVAEGEEMSPSRWTEEEVELLRKLASTGLSLSQIARQMRRNVTTVRVRARKCGIAIASNLRGLAKHRRLIELGQKAKSK
jgi:hypothetical protein